MLNETGFAVGRDAMLAVITGEGWRLPWLHRQTSKLLHQQLFASCFPPGHDVQEVVLRVTKR